MKMHWQISLLAVLLIALLAALAVFFVRDDGEVSVAVGQPEIVTSEQLSNFAGEARNPVYWLGPVADSEYELTETAGKRIYIRYLTNGAEAGDNRAAFVAVGTYPGKDGVAALRRAARRLPGAKLGRTKDGAVLLIDPSSPDNAHLVYPEADVQIEVYSPVAGQALRTASRGEVQPVH